MQPIWAKFCLVDEAGVPFELHYNFTRLYMLDPNLAVKARRNNMPAVLTQFSSEHLVKVALEYTKATARLIIPDAHRPIQTC